MKGGRGGWEWTTARRRLRRESTARPRKEASEGRVVSERKVSTTPASDTAAMMRWRRDPRRKCWARGSHARDSGYRLGDRKLMT